MKNQKHTPGPWTAQTVKCVDRNMWVREIINERGDCVAELSVETTEQKHTNPNESLILAAPELLEALELALETLIHTTDFRTTNLVRETIRKARGEL